MSKRGCHLCRIIESDLANQNAIDKIHGRSAVVAKTVAYKGVIVLFQPPKDENAQGKAVDVDVKIVIEQLNVSPSLTTIFNNVQDGHDNHTGSISACRIASRWLTECSEHHTYCNTAAPLKARLPTRVLDLRSVGHATDLHLVENSEDTTDSYAALSHCWGGNSHIQTTTSTLQAYLGGIEEKALPKTFAEAVQITRALDIRYLWIDSLCIVQDSTQDWENEAAQMGRYYSNALVTISAAHGSNSDAGLFVERDGLSTQPCRLNLKYGSERRQVYVYARNTSFQMSRSSLSEQKQPLPLYSRSWVLQEQLLASRTLTYGKFGISWRCQTMRFDERAPLAMAIDDFVKDKPSNLATFRGDPRETETTMAELQRNWIFPRLTRRPDGGKANEFQVFHRHEHCAPSDDHFIQAWGRLVQDYTSRGLTRQTDKLVAISGIASIISSRKSLEYTGGIWNGSSEMLIQGLLWSASKRGQRLLEVAPSWSWASIECEVTWPGHLSVGFRLTAEVLRFECTGNATCSKGSIMIQARTRQGVIDKEGRAKVITEHVSGCEHPDAMTATCPHWKQGVVSLDEAMPEGTALLFVEVATGKVNYTRIDSLVHALVLRKNEEISGTYRRVGFSSWNDEFWKKPTETASEATLEIVTIE
ncbi:heterokaryon incompatibility protein-domain-containing protein [Lophiotrema nucula]|uniref:Heterokaryon incompatibility protein-domain-containing protein n=1 Tax=Lophiotrema nucula TaxID=690887 RepID=A0A6A5YPG5_9PLEO|nr:heterokaryon incompatibility protein-domain-containing protein [Lophiotrema nucula]